MGKQHRGAARVAFLARLGAIRSLFDAGHTLTAIYDAHRDALGVMSYSQFTRYVARYVRGQPKRLKGSEDRLGALAGDASRTAASCVGREYATPVLGHRSNRLDDDLI
ncbi:TraK family protein [Bordetella trematum]|uniref:TraK family protein n=1 Tax=Bordetella trematum TaxID=123899 RepID=UPI0039893DFD